MPQFRGYCLVVAGRAAVHATRTHASDRPYPSGPTWMGGWAPQGFAIQAFYDWAGIAGQAMGIAGARLRIPPSRLLLMVTTRRADCVFTTRNGLRHLEGKANDLTLAKKCWQQDDLGKSLLDARRRSRSNFGPKPASGSAAMHAETLDAEFYRERARLCHTLAEAATAAKPIFSRLYFLARAYEQRATAYEAKKAAAPATEKSLAPGSVRAAG